MTEFLVERVAERQLYQDFLASNIFWVMLVTGLGGSGKSEFLLDLDELSPSESCVVLLNFARKSLQNDALSVLAELAWRIESYCDEERSSEFKSALRAGRYQMAEFKTTIIQQLHLGANAASEGASQIISVADSRERQQQVWALVTEAFYTQLASFKLNRLIILLDNCEWITEQDSGKPESLEVGLWLMDDLIPGIHVRMQLKHQRCSVVIASSLPLSLKNVRSNHQQSCSLDRLDKTAVDRYFEQLGMQDSLLRQYIYDNITYGHAKCVEIIGRLWHTHGPFAIADLPRLQLLFKEHALDAFINQYILNKHLNSQVRNLLHYGVLLRSFDQPLLQAVFPRWLPETEAFDLFHKLIRYPYVKHQNNNRYAFLELMRDILANYIREKEPEKWQDYHQKALAYLTSKSHIDRYYHALAYDEPAGLSDWKHAVQKAYGAGTYEQIATLLEIAADKTLKLSLAACAERAYQCGRFYAQQKQWETAIGSYREALTLFEQMGDDSAQIRVREALDDVLQRCTIQ